MRAEGAGGGAVDGAGDGSEDGSGDGNGTETHGTGWGTGKRCLRLNTFSGADRDGVWRTLGTEVFDALVIGGGITGVGIARELAGRGLSTALVEGGDIGGGTSSRSSRLVHGGLRYLETFEFGLVFEALRERRRLLKLAPHLVRPLRFVFPVYRGDPTGLAKLTAGMWLYESLSLFRSPERHRVLGRVGTLATEPMLRREGLVGGAQYADGQVDDARLTLAVARAAHGAGATILSHALVTAISTKVGAPSTVVVRDHLRERDLEIRARLVVNATGPWSDGLRRLADPSAAARLRTTKGAHVLVPRKRVGNQNAIIFRSPVDGRVMFVLPWGAFTYVGTTDTEYGGEPGAAVADERDVGYLLDSANHIFPEAELTRADVVSTWAGVRPLLAPTRSSVSESATSREHSIWRDASGLLNVAGGKLTTFRSMAAEVAQVAADLLHREFSVLSGRVYTELLPLPGAPEDEGLEALLQRTRARVRGLGLDEPVARGLVARHGSDADRVLDLALSDRTLAVPILDGLDYLMAEAVWAVRAELALTLEDILRRRLQVFSESRDGGLTVAERVARTVAAEPALKWDETAIRGELARYATAVGLTRAAGL